MIVNACNAPSSNNSSEEYSYRLVANVSKLKGRNNKVIGSSFIVSTSTKKNPARILNFIWGMIILKYVVDDLRPIIRDASSIDLGILSNPDSKELLESAISLIVKAIIKPNKDIENKWDANNVILFIKIKTPKAITTPGKA